MTAPVLSDSLSCESVCGGCGGSVGATGTNDMTRIPTGCQEVVM